MDPPLALQDQNRVGLVLEVAENAKASPERGAGFLGSACHARTPFGVNGQLLPVARILSAFAIAFKKSESSRSSA
jgi:hypothetical protein